MGMLIEKLKIANFLSFLGEYEVNLKPCTAVMCNYYEGKDDFFRAFEFVFSATLSDLRVENPLDLVHKTLREEFLINHKIYAYVEVTLSSPQEKEKLRFSRTIKNGTNNPRIEHKVSDLITTRLLYEEKLNSLGVHIKQKNLIFYKSYFNNVIWGDSEDLELTICTCLRETYLFDEWKKAKKKLENLKKLKSYSAVKEYNLMKKSHLVIAKYTKKFETFWKYKEAAAEEILKNAIKDFSNESTPSLTGSAETKSLEDPEKKELTIVQQETKLLTLTRYLNYLKLKEATLTSHLYHEEIKLAAKPVNASILQNRISLLKSKILENENRISEIWEEMQSVQFVLEDITRKISFALISLKDLQIRKFLQNRFTQYGRFNDYLQPSRYVQLLKQIIGPEIFYANLCDSVDDAFVLLQQLQDLKYEHREIFLPFENYSHKFRDVIIASGEKGVQINTLEELLIFLCKLKHFCLIDEVPVIVQRNFNYENAIPEDYTVYIYNNLYFTTEGLISLKMDENYFLLESQDKMEENLGRLYTEEEINYRKWDDLLFLKLETLVDMNSLENDVFNLKQKWKKSIQKPYAVRESSPAMELYEEYYDIFKQYAEKREKYESEEQQEKEPFLVEDSSTSSNEESVSAIIKDLADVTAEKIKTHKEVEDLSRQMHHFNIIPLFGWKLQGNFITFQNNLDKGRFFFEKELKNLKKLMAKDEIEDFLGSQEWRMDVIGSLIKDSNEIKRKFLTATEELQCFATARKRKLYQLFDHCSRFLNSTFGQILVKALPFLKLDFGPGEEKVYILSCLEEEKINLIDIKHFNTFIRFISAFAIFLEIARFEKCPFIIFDDIEEYFPVRKDNFEAILQQNTLEKILPNSENPRFHLLMRLGHFLKLYIKKNTPGKHIRHNRSNADHTNGPMQVIYFTKEDFVLSAEHFIWIHNQILPEDYITENCNSYSEMHEINF